MYSLCIEYFKLVKQLKQLQLQCAPLHDSADQSTKPWTRGSVKREAGSGIEITLVAIIKTLRCMQLKVTES